MRSLCLERRKEERENFLIEKNDAQFLAVLSINQCMWLNGEKRTPKKYSFSPPNKLSLFYLVSETLSSQSSTEQRALFLLLKSRPKLHDVNFDMVV